MSVKAFFESIVSGLASRHYGSKIQEAPRPENQLPIVTQGETVGELRDSGVQVFVQDLLSALLADQPITLRAPLTFKVEHDQPALKFLMERGDATQQPIQIVVKDSGREQTGAFAVYNNKDNPAARINPPNPRDPIRYGDIPGGLVFSHGPPTPIEDENAPVEIPPAPKEFFPARITARGFSGYSWVEVIHNGQNRGYTDHPSGRSGIANAVELTGDQPYIDIAQNKIVWMTKSAADDRYLFDAGMTDEVDSQRMDLLSEAAGWRRDNLPQGHAGVTFTVRLGSTNSADLYFDSLGQLDRAVWNAFGSSPSCQGKSPFTGTLTLVTGVTAVSAVLNADCSVTVNLNVASDTINICNGLIVT